LAGVFEWGRDEKPLGKEEHLVFLTVPIPPNAARGSALEESVNRLELEILGSLGGQCSVGSRITSGEILVFIRGANADQMWERCLPILEGSSLKPHGYALRRYGDAGAVERQTTF
jgi:hypothetical protein